MHFVEVSVAAELIVLLLNSERSLRGARSSDVGVEDPQSSGLP